MILFLSCFEADDLPNNLVVKLSANDGYKPIAYLGRAVEVGRRTYRMLEELCQGVFNASAMNLPSGYENPEATDETVREMLGQLTGMLDLAYKNRGLITHMVVNGLLGLPLEDGTPPIEGLRRERRVDGRYR